jgi:eukaryotic-like serine/threonine-protein kinase
MPLSAGTKLGHYEVVSLLGRGGMGEVYRAHDVRLDRDVALKIIARPQDEHARARFEREARAAATVSHPNICQIHEIGEDGSTLFIAMELLAGESLADRLARGPLGVAEAIRVSVQALAALQALHDGGLVHRDLKPTNIFLSAHAVKLLDFGLAQRVFASKETVLGRTTEQLTLAGTVLGTPHYMSPEQIQGSPTDARTDLFAMGATLFEMLSGQRAFAGKTELEVLHATLRAEPPALGGSRTIEGVNRVVQRMLAKNPDDRPASASSIADELHACLLLGDVESVTQALTMTWLIVLPFRILRSDAETDFLAFSLPDAIASSLSGLRTLGVRSTAGAGRFVGEEIDFARIAAEAHVDLVMTGTLLRAGAAVRVNTQLVGAPGGSVLWSHTAQATLRDVFQLQDDLVQRIVASLSLPLTAREHRLLKHDVPASSTAYEFYLRANQMLQQANLVLLEPAKVARDLYLRSVEDDSQYAPAWANLGRCYRVLGKAGGEDADENLKRAESCLQRALALNPELASATKAYAQLESDLGRSGEGLARLIACAHANDADPEVWAGLVHACRYRGLLEASVAAHERARQLDPAIATSVRHTYWLLGDAQRSLQGSQRFYFEAMVLASTGRAEEALTCLLEIEQTRRPELMRMFLASLRALLDHKHSESLAATEFCIRHLRDPEATFYLARQLAQLGETERTLEVLTDVLNRGYLCSRALAGDPWLHGLRTLPAFDDLLQRAVRLEQEAARAFAQMGGHQLLQ